MKLSEPVKLLIVLAIIGLFFANICNAGLFRKSL